MLHYHNVKGLLLLPRLWQQFTITWSRASAPAKHCIRLHHRLIKCWALDHTLVSHDKKTATALGLALGRASLPQDQQPLFLLRIGKYVIVPTPRVLPLPKILALCRTSLSQDQGSLSLLGTMPDFTIPRSRFSALSGNASHVTATKSKASAISLT